MPSSFKRPPSKLYWHDDVYGSALPLQLVAIAFTTGLLDSVTFPDFGIFVSNQTGNTILLALAAAGLLDHPRVVDTVLSLFPFLIAICTAGQIGRRVGCTDRLWLVATSFFQAALVLLVGALIYGHVLIADPNDPTSYAIVVLLAVSSGAQVAMAKTVSVSEVPTAMLTSPYADLLCDADLFALHNPSRDRRLLYIITIFLGSLVGAFVRKHATSELAIVLAGGLKLLICLSFLVNAPRKIPDPEPAVPPSREHAGSEAEPRESSQ